MGLRASERGRHPESFWARPRPAIRLPHDRGMVFHDDKATSRSQRRIRLAGDIRYAGSGRTPPSLTGRFTGSAAVTGTYARFLADAGFLTLAFDTGGSARAAAGAARDPRALTTSRPAWAAGGRDELPRPDRPSLALPRGVRGRPRRKPGVKPSPGCRRYNSPGADGRTWALAGKMALPFLALRQYSSGRPDGGDAAWRDSPGSTRPAAPPPRWPTRSPGSLHS